MEKKTYKKMSGQREKLHQEFDRYDWWPRHTKEQLEWLIKDKQDEMLKLRIKDGEKYSLRIEHLQWDIDNIEYVLGIGKQASIPMDAEFGKYAQQCKEHWDKMVEYSKETERLQAAFEKGLPTWLGGHDTSWIPSRNSSTTT